MKRAPSVDIASRDDSITISTENVSVSPPAQTVCDDAVCQCHGRRISPEAGHALEILGHAIEYLTDEYVHEGTELSSHDGRVKAIQLLMARNREIYLACPEQRTLRDRLRALFHHN